MRVRCGVYGEGSVFSVEIEGTAEVEALQEAIFDKQRYHERFSFPASALTLYLAKKDGAWLKSDATLKLFLKQGRQEDSEYISPIADADITLPCFEEPMKRRKLVKMLPTISEGGDSSGIRAAIERYYDIASVLGPDIDMARAAANQIARTIPVFSYYT
ncbi:CRN-like protein [Plasmopara halstedii]|uniref:CRN-like protein n=1 Tax=Plasmopara halstedii TaxID=4781 RepID=A0A0P1B4F8_PLAHL|nr:CRN-like protein [Plasmopara halstedii]CEG49193.1 CRN-like protein [Plasmopara halstedii]|eukprot:XP_024585562.1 CRN-like protein [Plasmopara halstedii]